MTQKTIPTQSRPLKQVGTSNDRTSSSPSLLPDSENSDQEIKGLLLTMGAILTCLEINGLLQD